MIIIKNLIKNYISNLSLNDIKNISLQNNINLSSNELDFIYNFIKNNYNNIIDNPSNFNLINYKDKFSNENYLKLDNLINEYKLKYNIK
ncbi:MAG: DUF2624 family protein [Bacilli bacterium]|nr:DUF2624 family protein [Bacilli bacterium]